MKDIKNIELISAVLAEWEPADLAFIEKINIFPQEEENSKMNAIIHFYSQSRQQKKMWPDSSQSFFKIVVEFQGVTDLELHFSGHGLQQITGFEIVDTNSRGWENINFSIEDYENGKISFNAEEIAILSISEPVHLYL